MNAIFTINGKQIETERLILRPFKETDLKDFYEYASEEGVGEMAGWEHHASIEKSKEILDIFISEDKTFAICCKENGKVIGSLGVEFYGLRVRSPNLTATEAGSLALFSRGTIGAWDLCPRRCAP